MYSKIEAEQTNLPKSYTNMKSLECQMQGTNAMNKVRLYVYWNCNYSKLDIYTISVLLLDIISFWFVFKKN